MNWHKRTTIAAIKLGSKGAIGVQGKRQVYASSIPVNVVDTIGAGDTFDAGFLFGYLNGWDVGKISSTGSRMRCTFHPVGWRDHITTNAGRGNAICRLNYS